MKCNHEEKYFCRECIEFLCESCKTKHAHNKNNILNVSSQTDLKKELQKLKDETKPNYSKYEKMDNIEKRIGLTNLFNSFKEVNSKLQEFIQKIDLPSISSKLSFIKSNSDLIKDLSLNSSMKKNDTISSIKRMKEYKTSMLDISYFSDYFQQIFEDKEMLLFELYNILFINNNTNKLSDTTLNLSSFNIEPIEEEKPVFAVNTDKIHNLIKLNEFEEKIRLLENENAKLIEINDKYNIEIKRIGTIQNKLVESNENLNTQLKNFENNRTKNSIIIDDIIVNSSEIKDLVYDKKDSIISELIKQIIENKFSQKSFDELDQFSILSILKSNTKTLLEKLKLTDLIFENYYELNNIKQFFQSYYQTFKQSNLNKEINDAICEKITENYFNLIFENRFVIMNIVFDNFFQNYTCKSKKFKSQKNVDMKSCQINDNDVGKLVNILQSSTKLTDIFLQNNEITDNGFYMLLSAILNNKSLKNVYLDNNKLSDNSLKFMSNFIKTIDTKQVALKVLSLQNNNFSEKGKEILKPIKLVLKVLIYI